MVKKIHMTNCKCFLIYTIYLVAVCWCSTPKLFFYDFKPTGVNDFREVSARLGTLPINFCFNVANPVVTSQVKASKSMQCSKMLVATVWQSGSPVTGSLQQDIAYCMPPTIAEHMDGLVQERSHSSVLAVELRLSCTDPLIYHILTTIGTLKLICECISQMSFWAHIVSIFKGSWPCHDKLHCTCLPHLTMLSPDKYISFVAVGVWYHLTWLHVNWTRLMEVDLQLTTKYTASLQSKIKNSEYCFILFKNTQWLFAEMDICCIP